jgi:hypothetical protein
MKSKTDQNLGSSIPDKKDSHLAAIRPRARAPKKHRIQLHCGCSIHVTKNCAVQCNGFSHRGGNYFAASREWSLLLANKQPPILQDTQPPGEAIRTDGLHNDTNQIQLQPTQAPTDTQMLADIQGLDDIDTFLNWLSDEI